MLSKNNRFISWLLCGLLCFSNSFSVINAEEEIIPENEPEVQEITVEENQETEEEQENTENNEELPEETPDISEEQTLDEPEASEEYPAATIEPAEVVEEVEITEEPVAEPTEETELEQEDVAEELQIEENENEEATIFYDNQSNGFRYRVENGEAVITGCYDYGLDGALEIPSELDGYLVTSIDGSAFYTNSSITSVTIPGSVKNIGQLAFGKCPKLTSVTISNGVTHIGGNAFNSCINLPDITIPDSVTSIGDGAFASCESFTSITIPKSVTSIGVGIVLGCVNITSINVDGDNAVYDSRYDCNAIIETNSNKLISGCSNTVIPEGITSIESRAFRTCKNLTGIKIPDSVTSIGNEAFYNCRNLASIKIPNNVTSVGDSAFYNCTNLKTVTLGKNITYIGNDSFEGCSFSSIDIPNSVTSIGFGAFRYNENLVGIKIPDKVRVIDRYVFEGCSKLKTVILGKKVLSIESGAFKDCASLTSITIHDLVKNIEVSAFSGCDSLTDVYYTGTEEQWNLISIMGYNDSLLNATFHYNYITATPLVQSGTFAYYTGITHRLEQYQYDYDENWFTKSSVKYNHELARMSIRLAMAAFGAPSAEQHIANTEETIGSTHVKYTQTESEKSTSYTIVQMLKDLEFTDVEASYPIPSDSSIGFAIGSKRFIDENENETTLVAVAVRGANYYNEWASNFNVRDGETHYGFDIHAASHVFSNVKRYISELKRSNVKVWITGYSRAAATANLVGQKVISAANMGTLEGVKSDGVFTYCFECPRNVTEQYMAAHEDPAHIFSIVNENDLVTHVAFEKWSYDRFGTTYYLPSLEACGFADYPYAWSAMIYKYRDIIQAMGYSEDVAFDMALKNGTLAPAQEGLVDSIAELIGAIGYDPRWYYEHYQSFVTDTANDMFDIDKQENTDNQFITDVIVKAIERLIKKGGFSNPMSYMSLKALITMAGNGLMHAHFPELCMAWLDTLDGTEDYYSSNIRTRLLILNCPVDVDVYYQGQLAGRIVNDEAVDIGDNSLCVFVDHNGQKKVYLPGVDDYDIRITARDSGKMSYQIEERDMNSGDLYRVVNYIDVDITKDDQLTGTVSAMDENGLSYYNLYSPNGTEIAPTMDLTDSIAQYNVSLNASGKGYVSAGGLMNVGEYFKASAETEGGSEFVGWYKDDQLVSEEIEYRFCVLEDTELTALFRSIILDEEQLTLGIGEYYQIKPVIEPAYSTETELSYESLDEDVAVVDESGMITGVKSGTATIVISANGGLWTYLTVTVASDGIYIKNLDPSYIYTGTAIKPQISVYDAGKLLTNKTDYTITYKNTTKAYIVADPENPTAADKKSAPQIIIKSNSKGNYKGLKTVYFTIEPLDINDEQITVDELSVQETGKLLSPVPTVYFNGKKLKNKTDYIVDYSGWNRLTGDENNEAEITIIAKEKGNFSGERKVTVHVAPKGTTVPVSKLKVSVSALKYEDLTEENFIEKVEKAITVKDGKTQLFNGINYIIKDIKPEDRAVGSFKVTLEGDGYAYIGERTVTVKITGIALADKKIKAAVPSYTYTGEPLTLGNDFSIKYIEELLEEGKDYTVESYSNNINAGTATVVLKGLGRFTGTRKVTFKITPDTTADTRIVIVDPAKYCKGGSKPKISIEGLTEGIDYTVKYSNNTKADTFGTALITYKGNYKGTKPVPITFYIERKDISDITITSKDKVYSAKANAWKSAPVLKDTDGKALKAGTDYEKEISYTAEDGSPLTEPVPAGTVVKVTVTGKGNYTGAVSTTYRILETGKDISKATFKITQKEYTGSPVILTESDITATINKTTPLKLGTDFVIDGYTNNLKKGTAKVTFRGINGYGGTKTVSFKIGQRSIVDYWQGVKNFFSNLF